MPSLLDLIAAVTPIIVLLVGAYVQIKLAKIEKLSKEIKQETKAQTVKIDDQTEKIDVAANDRKAIAATLADAQNEIALTASKKIDEAMQKRYAS